MTEKSFFFVAFLTQKPSLGNGWWCLVATHNGRIICSLFFKPVINWRIYILFIIQQASSTAVPGLLHVYLGWEQRLALTGSLVTRQKDYKPHIVIPFYDAFLHACSNSFFLITVLLFKSAGVCLLDFVWLSGWTANINEFENFQNMMGLTDNWNNAMIRVNFFIQYDINNDFLE